jgi:hypothetical protein
MEQPELETLMMKYREPLEVLSGALEKARPSMTLVGTLWMHGFLTAALSNRMNVISFIRENYVALQKVKVTRPLFVVGLPRCGTTLTFNLLAAEPNARVVLHWQGLCPTLPEKTAKMQVGVGSAAIDYLSPSLKTAHEIGINDPEECLAWLSHTLICYLFCVVVNVPDYGRYLFEDKPNVRGAYRYHKYVLQILQMRYPEPANKHWVLKTPAHLQFIEELLEIYPDAIIVWNHRRLDQTLPSTCSLITHFQICTSKFVDYKSIGELVTTGAPVWLNNAFQARKKYPDSFYDLYFEDLVKDPIRAMQDIYTRFDLKWDDTVKNAMEARFKAMPRNKHGEHKYSMEEFGLDQDTLNRSCAEYLEGFNKKFKAGVAPASPSAPSPTKSASSERLSSDAADVEDS